MSTINNVTLRPFQRRVFDHVREGRSVILQAPTGSGKTRASLAPFIYNLACQENKLPWTARYAVPMRVLANQFYNEYHSIAANIDSNAPTRLVDTYRMIGRDAVSIQTGEQSDDPQMEAALTFCTIDQLLASFLAVPYGVDNIRANLNAGAIVGSYLILDEFHLYPLLREGKSTYGARTTAIEMLRLLRHTTPFVLMTATFSTSLLGKLKELLGAEIENITDEDGYPRSSELEALAQGHTRTFELAEQPMDVDTILRQHEGCSLVICNTVQRAQRLFLQLKEHPENRNRRVILLHSRFTTEQRQAQAAEIEDELGPDRWKDGVYHGRDIIVVATQVVEVGLDISVRSLHSEISPANSLIQRAGRCARFKQQQGKVIIYPLSPDEKGRPANTLPYQKEICEATLQALKNFHGKVIGFTEEQKLIDAVHTDEDGAMLDQYSLNQGLITDAIFQSFNKNDRSVVSTLIRDVSQVQILIHDDPNEEITTEPWRWQSFALHPGSLKGRWQALQEQQAQLRLDWMCKKAVALKEDDPEYIDNRQKTSYYWEEVVKPDEISTALMIALPSKLASYYEDLGFVLLDGQLKLPSSDYQSTKRWDNKEKQRSMGSRQQTYQEHIQGLVRAYTHNIRDEISYIAHKLEEKMSLPNGTVDQAVRLAIACHDLGKLDHKWQQWAREWQQLLMEQQHRPYHVPEQQFFFAKTNFNYSREQRDLQKKVTTKRPHHACESVMLGMKLIAASLGLTNNQRKELLPVLRAICGAIARHHTPQASQFSSTLLDVTAREAAGEALKLAKQDCQWNYDLSLLDLVISKDGDLAPASAATSRLTKPESGPTSELETWLYFVIVRALRLTDQRADIP